jgi:4-amino-4-deoxy-L-arabinose transferase-like glycosyltransferase
MSPGIKTILFTLLAAAAVYFAGNGRVQLWDRDEPRYAQCSRQMLQSGDWVVPRLYDSLRTKKPPLIYWCQAAAMKIFGRDRDAESFAFAARVPSVLAMLGTLVVLSIVIRRNSGPEQAAWTVFIFATSGLAIVAAKICLTDSVLILFITIAQFCLYAIWRGNRSWSIAMAMAVMFGLGVMIKGPFIFGIVAATGAALGFFYIVDKVFERRRVRVGFPVVFPAVVAREDRPSGKQRPAPREEPPTSVRRADPTAVAHDRGTGGPPVSSEERHGRAAHATTVPRAFTQLLVMLLVIAALVAPWVLLVQHRAPEFLPAMLHEGRQHAIGGKEGHSFPPGYHLALVWPMFMPWSLLLPLAIGTGLRNRKIPEVRFALAAVLGPWLMVEFMGTKLPHYFLPAYPALAFLVAFAIRRCLRGESNDLHSRPFLIGAAVWAIAVAAVGAAPWLAARAFGTSATANSGATLPSLPLGAMFAMTVMGVLVGAMGFFLLCTRRITSALVTMGLGMFAMIALAWTFYFPHADFLRISIHAATVLKERGAIHPGDAKMVDYKEPSLAFYQGGTIREVEKKADLIYKPLKEWPRWVVMTREAWEMVPARYKDEHAGERLRIIDSCRGWAYADQGRVVELLVVENCK